MEFLELIKVTGFFFRWNNIVAVRHPSLWVFLRKLKDEQAIHEIKVRGMLNGARPPRRRLKWQQLENRIVHLKTQLQNGGRDLEEYWMAVRHSVAEFAVV